jgi:hypothetical protein
VVLDRDGAATTVRRTLDAAHARSLAALVNRLPVFGPGVYHCPAYRGWTDMLTFHSPGGELRVVSQTGGCGGVSVGPASAHNTALRGGEVVDRALLRALGLPRDYGR